MSWFRRLFGARAPLQPVHTVPERPADWHLTLDDLFEEMRAGKRKSVANPEMEWAKQYERSLIPEGIRFPRKGDLYESKDHQNVEYITSWAGPFSGGGHAILLKGERIWVEVEPREDKPLGAYALPVDYYALEERMVPQSDRKSPKYGGFHFYFKTLDLNRNFTLIRSGFRGKGRINFG